MIFEELTEYKKDTKRLLKRYQTLHDDLSEVKMILSKKPEERPPLSYSIDRLGLSSCIIKVMKIACRALKGQGVNAGLRLVYAHFPNEQRIVFIELYHKGEKETEDRQRILDNFG